MPKVTATNVLRLAYNMPKRQQPLRICTLISEVKVQFNVVAILAKEIEYAAHNCVPNDM